MNNVSWNYKGLENSSKVEDVKDILRIDSPYILLLQETKIEEDFLLSLSNKNWKTNVGKVVSNRGFCWWNCNLVAKEYFLSGKLSCNVALDFIRTPAHSK